MAVAHTTAGWKNMTKLRREVLYVPGVNVILGAATKSEVEDVHVNGTAPIVLPEMCMAADLQSCCMS